LKSHDKRSDDCNNLFSQWKQRRVSVISKGSSSGQGVDVETRPVDVETRPTAAALQRRRSTFKGVATSLTQLLGIRRMTKGRLSINQIEDVKPKQKMENTYKMKPDEDKEFKSSQVEKVTYSLMENMLKDEKYDCKNSNRLACDLSQLIINRVKGLNFPRYRIIVNVVIGQSNGQGLQMASRAVWDTSTDTFTSVSYKNDSLFAIATIHGVYLD